MFGYIPDATNLGTTFVNAIANILTTCAHEVDLKLTFPKGKKIEKVIVGEFMHQITDNKSSAIVHIGDVRYGQDLEFLMIFENEAPETFSAYLPYISNNKQWQMETKNIAFNECEVEENLAHLFRFEVIHML